MQMLQVTQLNKTRNSGLFLFQKDFINAYRISFLLNETVIGGVTLLKKLRKNDYNWAFHYIKEYNQMVSFYEKQLNEKNQEIKKLNKELEKIKLDNKFKIRQKQISDKDIDRIKQLKEQGKSYSYISKETGWSKATISRVINNKNNMY